MRCLLAVIVLSFVLPIHADENRDSRYSKRLGRMHAKQSWQVLTTRGVETIKGNFGGMANGTFFIEDEDGMRYQVPIGSLVDQEHRFLDSFQGRTGISLPGEHQRRLQSSGYSEYVYRQDTRFRDALELRRQYNAQKGPARGWTAINVPFNRALPFGGFLSHGFVRQPPIPRPTRSVFVVPQVSMSPGYVE